MMPNDQDQMLSNSHVPLSLHAGSSANLFISEQAQNEDHNMKHTSTIKISSQGWSRKKANSRKNHVMLCHSDTGTVSAVFPSFWISTTLTLFLSPLSLLPFSESSTLTFYLLHPIPPPPSPSLAEVWRWRWFNVSLLNSGWQVSGSQRQPPTCHSTSHPPQANLLTTVQSMT